MCLCCIVLSLSLSLRVAYDAYPPGIQVARHVITHGVLSTNPTLRHDQVRPALSTGQVERPRPVSLPLLNTTPHGSQRGEWQQVRHIA